MRSRFDSSILLERIAATGIEENRGRKRDAPRRRLSAAVRALRAVRCAPEIRAAAASAATRTTETREL